MAAAKTSLGLMSHVRPRPPISRVSTQLQQAIHAALLKQGRHLRMP